MSLFTLASGALLPQSIHLAQVASGVETQLCLLQWTFPVLLSVPLSRGFFARCKNSVSCLSWPCLETDRLGGLEGERAGQRQSFIFLFGMVVWVEACILL